MASENNILLNINLSTQMWKIATPPHPHRGKGLEGMLVLLLW